MKTFRWTVAGAALALFLGGCASGLFDSPVERLDRAARTHGFTRHAVAARGFSLLTYLRPGDSANRRLAVYIEGDGRKWPRPDRPPADPTPRESLVLNLAIRDPLSPVLYVARPCQFLAPPQLAACHPSYWTDRRYGPKVVAAIGDAIDRTRAEIGAREVELIGYSGGATIAALLAARRTDIVRLITVAGNLDVAAWVKDGGLTPLTGSLDPADFASALRGLDQTHFYGEKDEIVPPVVQKSFMAKLGAAPRARLVPLAGFDHRCCWEAEWPRLLRLAEGNGGQ